MQEESKGGKRRLEFRTRVFQDTSLCHLRWLPPTRRVEGSTLTGTEVIVGSDELQICAQGVVLT